MFATGTRAARTVENKSLIYSSFIDEFNTLTIIRVLLTLIFRSHLHCLTAKIPTAYRLTHDSLHLRYNLAIGRYAVCINRKPCNGYAPRGLKCLSIFNDPILFRINCINARTMDMPGFRMLKFVCKAIGVERLLISSNVSNTNRFLICHGCAGPMQSAKL